MRDETAGYVPRRDLVLVSCCIALITLLAWGYLIDLDRRMASSMEHDVMMEAMGMSMQMPWTPTDVAFTFVMWAVMMVGMMTASASPMLVLVARGRGGRATPGAVPTVLLFGAGYFAVWTGFSLAATLIQWMLHEAAMLSPMMAATSPTLAGAILVAAGIYQLTPFKSACLTHCRSPLGFLMGHWRDGLTGALAMGVRHGAYCLGCCWALMAVLFVVGVMNLAWVAALSVFVLIEKVGPAGLIVARVAGVVMIVFGIRLGLS